MSAEEQLRIDHGYWKPQVTALQAEVERLRDLLAEARERELRYVLSLYRDDDYLARIDAVLAEPTLCAQSAADVRCPCGALYVKVEGGYVPSCACAADQTVCVKVWTDADGTLHRRYVTTEEFYKPVDKP